MMRTIPSSERFVELINRFASDHLRNLDVDTHAIPFGGRYGLGIADYIRAQERTTKQRAIAWMTEAATSDDPPFYLLRVRQGGVYVIQMDGDGHQVETFLSQLGLCVDAVEEHVLLDERGAFYSPRLSDDAQPTPVVIEGEQYVNQPPRRASGGEWVITPEGLRHLVAQATQEQALVAEQEQRERKEEAALVDSRHGVDLDYIRALLAYAELDPTDRHLVARPFRENTVASLTLKDDEITKLADALASLGLIPITRAEAAERVATASK